MPGENREQENPSNGSAGDRESRAARAMFRRRESLGMARRKNGNDIGRQCVEKKLLFSLLESSHRR